MSPNECATWIQSGLALTPFAGCQVGSSLDWTLAWSVIGEWTSRALESSFHLLPVTGRETATLRSYLEIMTVDCLLYSHGHEHALNRDHYLPCCTCLDRQNCSYVLVIECTETCLPLLAKDGCLLPLPWSARIPNLHSGLGRICDQICPDPLTEREELLLLSQWKTLSVYRA